MTDAPRAPVDPFADTVRCVSEPHPARSALRAVGPIVRADAPAGGPVWIITDDALAREVLLRSDRSGTTRTARFQGFARGRSTRSAQFPQR